MPSSTSPARPGTVRTAVTRLGPNTLAARPCSSSGATDRVRSSASACRRFCADSPTSLPSSISCSSVNCSLLSVSAAVPCSSAGRARTRSPEPPMRLVIDTSEFGVKHTPKFNTISISGYHIRKAGSTAIQELAFTLRDGLEYVEWGMRRGLNVDEFVPQLSFFFNAHSDFFEEIAKYRAARRIWHKAMVELYGAKNSRTWALPFHSHHAGCSLTAQHPYNNVVRTALQALAAVLGGTQSLHTNSLDEAWALPTEFAATIALRTQQIIAHETGVTNTVDPLGGSYFVETLTNEVERGAWNYIEKIDALGGMVAAIERGYPQREIAEASYRYQVALDKKEKIMVGVNDYVAQEKPLEILQIDETVAHRQAERLQKLRAERSSDAVARQLLALRKASQGKENLMPFIIDAVKSYATLGEICDAMRDTFGTYEEVAIT